MLKQFRALWAYGFTVFFNAGISFGTVSLLTHRLTEVDYGIINLYAASLMFVTPFVAIGVQFLLGVDFFKMDEGSFRKHFTNAGSVPVLSCLFLTLLVLAGHSYIENFIHVNFLFTLLIPVTCLMAIYSDVILTLIRDKGMHGLFSAYSIGKNVVEIGLTITLVVFLHLQWQGRLASSILALVLISAVVLFFIRRWGLYTGVFERNAIRKNFFAGLPFVPERLAIFVLGFSDRFFINYFKGTADVGLYSAGAQVALVVTLSVVMLTNVFYPSIYRTLSREEIDYVHLRKIIFSYIGIAAFIATAVILATPLFFRYFIGPRFNSGKLYAVYLAIGLFFWAIYNVFLAFLLHAKRNHLIMTISIIGMIMSLATNLFFVRWFGALGATFTSIIVYFVMAVTTIYSVDKHYSLRKLFGFRN